MRQDLVVHLAFGGDNGAQEICPEGVVKGRDVCRCGSRCRHHESPRLSVGVRSSSSSARRRSPSVISPSVSTWAHKVVPVKAAQASCWVGWGEAQVWCGASPYNVTPPRQKRRPTNWWRA